MTLEESLTDLMSRETVLVAVDFDGTLAPLVDHPDDAAPDSRAIQALRELAGRRGVSVAVVSGRSYSDLAERLGEVPGAVLIGEHGNDPGNVTPSPHIEAARAFIEDLRGDRDAVVESKPSSVTFHTRLLSDTDSSDAAAAIRSWARTHPDVLLLEGKDVFELSVAGRTKGDAIGDLAEGVDGVLYIGDDTTDESVFVALGPNDVGVKVGPGPTAARYRVADTSGVVDLLAVIVLASS